MSVPPRGVTRNYSLSRAKLNRDIRVQATGPVVNARNEEDHQKENLIAKSFLSQTSLSEAI